MRGAPLRKRTRQGPSWELGNSSGAQAVQVAWEGGHFPYVRRADQPGDEPFQPDREPAVRRHPAPEDVQVRLVRRRVRARRPQRGQVVGVPVPPPARR